MRRVSGVRRLGGRRAGLLAAVALLVLAGAVTWAAVRRDTAQAPATRQALAAVAVDVLGIEPSSYEPDLDLPYGVRVNWHPGGSADAHALYLDIQPDDAVAGACEEDCATWDVDGDEVRMTWQDASVESDPGRVELTYAADGELRSLAYHGVEISGDPRRSDHLPVPVSELVEVVTDERFASTTTQQVADVELEGWPQGWEDDDDPAETTPTLVASWMEGLGLGVSAESEAAGAVVTSYSPAVHGDDAVGARVRFDGWSVSAVIVPPGSASRCPRGWHCRTRPHDYVDRDWEVTTGWRRGQALVVNHLEGRDVVARVTSPTIDRFPRPVRRGDPVRVAVGDAVEAFEKHLLADTGWDLTTTQGALDGYAGLEPFGPR